MNEQAKIENKSLINDIDQLKNQILNYESTLANQCSKINLLEKEMDIYKSPFVKRPGQFAYADPLVYQLPQVYDNKNESNSNSTKIQEQNLIDSCKIDLNPGNNKLQENLNFLLTVK
jgi:hypothetical protein